jgi:hypothetical protein
MAAAAMATRVAPRLLVVSDLDNTMVCSLHPFCSSKNLLLLVIDQPVTLWSVQFLQSLLSVAFGIIFDGFSQAICVAYTSAGSDRFVINLHLNLETFITFMFYSLNGTVDTQMQDYKEKIFSILSG